jgi:NAD(P)-dependent dehydrogenase (short-subunit alcohol dehydrogenase family)
VESKSEAVIDLSGKLAIVTGAGRGIGAAIAETFAGAGADLVIADINEDSAWTIAEKTQHIGRKALVVKTDVASPADVDRLFAIVQEKFAGVDILVNNTGIWFRRPFLEIADNEWDNVLAVNLKGTFMCSQRAASDDGKAHRLHHQHRVSRRAFLQPRARRPLRGIQGSDHSNDASAGL